mgnify:CR=1 FL=1
MRCQISITYCFGIFRYFVFPHVAVYSTMLRGNGVLTYCGTSVPVAAEEVPPTIAAYCL